MLTTAGTPTRPSPGRGDRASDRAAERADRAEGDRLSRIYVAHLRRAVARLGAADSNARPRTGSGRTEWTQARAHRGKHHDPASRRRQDADRTQRQRARQDAGGETALTPRSLSEPPRTLDGWPELGRAGRPRNGARTSDTLGVDPARAGGVPGRTPLSPGQRGPSGQRARSGHAPALSRHARRGRTGRRDGTRWPRCR